MIQMVPTGQQKPNSNPRALTLMTFSTTPKIIHVDYKRVRAGTPATMIRNEAGYVLCRYFIAEGAIRTFQAKERLFPDGPNVWIETRARISIPDHNIIQTGDNPPMTLNWENVGTMEMTR